MALFGDRGLEVREELSLYLAQCQAKTMKEEPQGRVENEKQSRCWISKPETGRNIGPIGIHRSWGRGNGDKRVSHRIWAGCPIGYGLGVRVDLVWISKARVSHAKLTSVPHPMDTLRGYGQLGYSVSALIPSPIKRGNRTK